MLKLFQTRKTVQLRVVFYTCTDKANTTYKRNQNSTHIESYVILIVRLLPEYANQSLRKDILPHGCF